MKLILIKILSVLLIAVSGATSAYVVSNKPQEKNPVAEAATAKNDADKVIDKDIDPAVTEVLTATPTDTPKPTKETRPTNTPKPTVTVKPTDTPKPTPTKYVKNPEPKTEMERVENNICDVFGEADCQRAITLAKTVNTNLNPQLVWTPRVKGGVFMLLCDQKLMDILQVNTPSACVDRMLDLKTNIDAAYAYIKIYGWKSTLAI